MTITILSPWKPIQMIHYPFIEDERTGKKRDDDDDLIVCGRVIMIVVVVVVAIVVLALVAVLFGCSVAKQRQHQAL